MIYHIHCFLTLLNLRGEGELGTKFGHSLLGLHPFHVMDNVLRSLQEVQCPLPSDATALLGPRWSELVGWLLRTLDSANFERLVDTSSSSPDCTYYRHELVSSYLAFELL